MALTGGNIANLNIMVNSNVTQAIGQLTILQRTLQTLRGQSGSLIPNVGNLVGQIGSVNTATQQLNQSFTMLGHGGSAITNTLLGLALAGNRFRISFSGFSPMFGQFASNLRIFRDLNSTMSGQTMISFASAFGSNTELINVVNGLGKIKEAGRGIVTLFRNIGTSMYSWGRNTFFASVIAGGMRFPSLAGLAATILNSGNMLRQWGRNTLFASIVSGAIRFPGLTSVISGIANSGPMLRQLASNIGAPFRIASMWVGSIFQSIRSSNFGQWLGNLTTGIRETTSGMVGSIRNMFSSLRTSIASLGLGMSSLRQTIGTIGSAIFSALGIIAVAGISILITKLTQLGIQAIETGVKFNIMMEQMRTGYSVMLQGVGNSVGYGMEQADKLIGKLKAFADVTPFTLPQVTQGANQLIGYGVGEGKANQVEQISAAVAMLGDVSRGIPEKFNDIAYAYGQISAMGRLQGQELRQLINAGWNPLLEISKSTGKSLATLKKEMEDGAISIDDVTEALITATSEGGRFYGMMEKQAGTLFGIWSTLKDKVVSALGAITEGITENLKTILGYGITIMNALQFKVPGYSLLTYLDYIALSISTNIIPELERLGKYILYVFNADKINGDMRPAIDGVTESIGNGVKYLGMFGQWVVAVTNIVRVMFGVMNTGFNMMRAGVMTIWSLFKGLLLAVASGLNVIVFGLGGIFEGLGRSIGSIAEKIGKTFANGFMKGGNAIIDFLNNNLGLGLSTWKPFEITGGWGIMDAFGKDNANWNLMLSNMETIKAGWGTIGDDWLKTMGTLNAEMIASSKDVKKAWDELTTTPDLSKVDKFLAALKAQGKTPKVPVVDKKSLLGNAVQDLTKTTEAANKLAESILNITDKLVNMGNVFEKMTYEKFSPYKLVVRMQRFFNEMSKWTVNLAQLQTQGVPAGMINQLQEMGVQGYGITKGLVNATDAQRKQIIDQYQQSKGMAFGVAGQQAKYDEKMKAITVNVTGNSVVSPELVNILTDQIVKKLRLAGM